MNILLVANEKVYDSKMKALRVAFLPNIKYFGNKIGVQCNNTPLLVEHNNYASRIVNVKIVYDLDHWSKNPLIIFLFWATNIVKNNNKEKYKYSGYGIAFDGKGE